MRFSYLRNLKRKYSLYSHPYDKLKFTYEHVDEAPTKISIKSLLYSTPFLLFVITPMIVAYYMSPDWRGAREPIGYWSDSELKHIDPELLDQAKGLSYHHNTPSSTSKRSDSNKTSIYTKFNKNKL